MSNKLRSTLIPIRFVVLILCVMMGAILYLARVNLNVTLVAMVVQNKSEHNETDSCPNDEESDKSKSNSSSNDTSGEFDWDPQLLGLIVTYIFVTFRSYY